MLTLNISIKHVNTKMIKVITVISLFLPIIIVNSFQYNLLIYSQSENTDVIENNTWISKQDNLNVTMGLVPKVPNIDEKTKITFEIRKLNNSVSLKI